MQLKGSCHCQAVSFTVQSRHPYPFMRCYCSICRKTAGAGGYAVNLGALYDTLVVDGDENVSVYRARLTSESGEAGLSSARRHFCRQCGSALWLWDPNWPDLVHPHASAIDTELPEPPQRTHIMLRSAGSWVQPDVRAGDEAYDAYPDESLAQWHQRHGLER